MLFTILLFVLSLIVLVKSANYFVHFAAKLAKRFGVSEFVIGLTLVAVGTSLPELANTIIASIQGVNDFALGNVIGSNMANLGLSVGLSLLLASIVVRAKLYRREIAVLVLGTAAFAYTASDGLLTRSEGMFLVLLFTAHLVYITKIYRDFATVVKQPEVEYFVRYLSHIQVQLTPAKLYARYHQLTSSNTKAIALDMLGVIVSCVFLIGGSTLLVKSVVALAAQLGIANGAVAATLVALGTTTPELSVSIASVRKGYHDLLFGNIIGSNIVNILLILGIGAYLHPIAIVSTVLLRAVPLLCISTLLLAGILLVSWRVPRWVGSVFVLLYALFVALWFF